MPLVVLAVKALMCVTATRGDPEAYMMLMIISFLFIILFVTLVLSQNQ